MAVGIVTGQRDWERRVLESADRNGRAARCDVDDAGCSRRIEIFRRAEVVVEGRGNRAIERRRTLRQRSAVDGFDDAVDAKSRCQVTRAVAAQHGGRRIAWVAFIQAGDHTVDIVRRCRRDAGAALGCEFDDAVLRREDHITAIDDVADFQRMHLAAGTSNQCGAPQGSDSSVRGLQKRGHGKPCELNRPSTTRARRIRE